MYQVCFDKLLIMHYLKKIIQEIYNYATNLHSNSDHAIALVLFMQMPLPTKFSLIFDIEVKFFFELSWTYFVPKIPSIDMWTQLFITWPTSSTSSQ